jgi:hypothetical protein
MLKCKHRAIEKNMEKTAHKDTRQIEDNKYAKSCGYFSFNFYKIAIVIAE